MSRIRQFIAVTVVELTAVARRWQTFVLRGGLVLGLGCTLALVCLSYQSGVLLVGGRLTLREYAEAGSNFAIAVLGVQLALVLFAGPAATAGAICLDKSRGNLVLLMTTEMSSAEFVIGKLVGRLTPVLSLVVVSLPVLFITSFLGGINGQLLTGGFIVLVGAAVLGCAISILMSLYVGRTFEALLLSFLLLLVWMALYPISLLMTAWPAAMTQSRFFWASNPVTLMLGPLDPMLGVNTLDYAMYLVWTLGLSLLAVMIAIVQLRRVVLRQAHRPIRLRGAKAFHRPRRPRQLDRDPLRWYERFRRRPSIAIRMTRFIYLLLAIAATSAAVAVPFLLPGYRELPMYVGPILVAIGLLFVVISAVSSLADERSRGSLDILATTPYTTPAILWAKWRAAFMVAPFALFFPALIGIGTWAQNENAQYQNYLLSVARWPNRLAWHYTFPQVNPTLTILLLIALLISCAAMLTSLSLFLALQLKNFTRAMGLAMICYIGCSVGWPLLIRLMGADNHTLVELFMLSPISASARTIESLGGMIWYSSTRNAVWAGAIYGTLVNIAAAVYFYVLCLIIANRKMGRISRTESRPIPVEDVQSQHQLMTQAS